MHAFADAELLSEILLLQAFSEADLSFKVLLLHAFSDANLLSKVCPLQAFSDADLLSAFRTVVVRILQPIHAEWDKTAATPTPAERHRTG